MRIVLAGGGSGGHLFPLIAITQCLRKKLNNEPEFLYLGPVGQMEREFLSLEGIVFKNVATGKLRRYFAVQNFIDPFFLIFGFLQSLWHLLVYMPDVVFSKGGYGSVPVVLAARLYHIPVLIHESDAMPGIANRVLGKLANIVALSYPSAKQFFTESKVILTGNPIHPQTVTGDASRARLHFNITDNKPVIFITGGSQGAEEINTAILKIISELLKVAIVIHQTGTLKEESVKARAVEYGIQSGMHGYHVVGFISPALMGDILALSNLVISRAGATSIAQIAAHKKPVILIPLLTAANDHQLINAYEIGKIGGAIVLSSKNLGEHLLLEKINEVLSDADIANKMANKISVFYHPDATDKIADGLITLSRIYGS